MNSRRTSNVQLRTSNVEVKTKNTPHITSTFSVRRSTFDVRIHRSAKAGFSFAEVMFAVVILGIGFIMVAAIFPVAIQQTQTNGEENIAASVARQAAAAIAALPMTIKNPIYSSTVTIPPPPGPRPPTTVEQELLFPPTVKNYVPPALASPIVAGNPYPVPPPAIVVPLVGNRWDLIKSNAILNTDPRYAFSAFYKRENGSNTAELIVVAMAVRNRTVYDNTDLSNYPAPASPQAIPPGNSTIQTTAQGDYPTPDTAHTIICPDTLVVGSLSTVTPYEGSYFEVPSTGRSYTLGRSVPIGATTGWELMPGDSMALTPGTNGLWGTTMAVPATSTLSGTALPAADAPLALTAANLCSRTTLQPLVAYARLAITPDAPFGRIVLSNTPDSTSGAPLVAATGAFVVIADDFPPLPGMNRFTGGPADYGLQPNLPYNSAIPGHYTVGELNGRIFRLGVQVPATPANTNANPVIAPGTFNLDPAYGMRPAPSAPAVPPGGNLPPPYSPDTIPNPYMLSNAQFPTVGSQDVDFSVLLQYGCARVYIIGVGKTDPTNVNSPTYSGSAQDIGAFVSYIRVQ